MKSTMKKIAALVISLVLVLSIACTALADEFEIIEIMDCPEETVVEIMSVETVETKEATGTVAIYACYEEEMNEGDLIVLVSEVSGLENCTVAYQWQMDNGNGFENIEGATESTFSFAATEESISCSYRLEVIAD